MGRGCHVLIIILATLCWGGGHVQAANNGVKPEAEPALSPGNFLVEVQTDQGWKPLGALRFNRSLGTRDIAWDGASHSIRITHRGSTEAHIDCVLLNHAPPSHVEGIPLDPALSIEKLRARDGDLIRAGNQCINLIFQAAERNGVLSLTARIEPEALSKNPLRYPVGNQFRDPQEPTEFFEYRLNSCQAAFIVDGELHGEALGTPLVKTWIEPISGHPSGFTYAWVANDAENLYVALDVVPDNTLDSGLDYGTVFIQTSQGVKPFTIMTDQQEWGVTGFTYTPRTAYQHKTYEFSIPLGELGVEVSQGNPVIPLALAVYGTVAVSGIVDDFGGPEGGQVLTARPGVPVEDFVSPFPGIAIIDERDVFGILTAGTTLTLDINSVPPPQRPPGMLFFDGLSGAGSFTLTWDGLDASGSLALVTLGDFSAYDRIVLENVANPGTQPVKVSLQIMSSSSASDFITSPEVTVAPGFGPQNIPFYFASSFTPTGSGVNLSAVGPIQLTIANDVQGGILTMTSIQASDVSLPVELLSVELE